MRRFVRTLMCVVLAALLAGGAAPAGPAPSAGHVTVRVTDWDTKQPVTDYEYVARVAMPGPVQLGTYEGWRRVRSPDGTFTIETPAVCLVSFSLRAKGYIDEGWPSESTYLVVPPDWLAGPGSPAEPMTWAAHGRLSPGSDNPGSAHDLSLFAFPVRNGRIETHLRRGRSVHGTVRDAETGLPIPDAKVAPSIFTPPLWSGDWDREVTTDAEGHFELEGVSSDDGIHVRHPLYATASTWEREIAMPEPGQPIEVDLRPAVLVKGHVVDSSGNPIEGAQVGGLMGGAGTSDEDGTFAIQPSQFDYDPSTNAFSFTATKDGFLPGKLEVPDDGDFSALQFVLQPELTFAGQVVGAEGQSVPKFTFVVEPDAVPRRWWYRTVEVEDPEGRFSVPVVTEEPFRLTIAAPGYATATYVTERQGKGDAQVIALNRGYAVKGRLASAGRTFADTKILLMLRRGSPWPELRQVEGRADEEGTFRLEHVAPGDYYLLADGAGMSPVVADVEVRLDDVDLGKLECTGTGRVVGTVHRPTRSFPWALAFGTMWHADSGEIFHFRSDAYGRFEVDNVPVGTIEVSFGYYETADIVNALTASVDVVEGETSFVSLGGDDED